MTSATASVLKRLWSNMGWGKLLVNLGSILLAGGAVIALQYPLLDRQLTGQTPESDRRAEQQEATQLALLQRLPPSGLGFNNLIACYAFMKFLPYFGDDIARVQHGLGYGLTADYFRVIITRDPRFLTAYFYMSTSLSMFAGKPREAIALYEYGEQVLDPRQQRFAHNILRHKANDQLLFLADVEGARQSLLKQVEWVKSATFKPEDTPPPQLVIDYTLELARLLATKKPEDYRTVQIQFWQIVLDNASDIKTVERVAQEIHQLGYQITVRKIDNIDRLVIVPK